jgi:hypothetical protein
MKKIMAALLVAALVAGSVFALEGLTVSGSFEYDADVITHKSANQGLGADVLNSGPTAADGTSVSFTLDRGVYGGSFGIHLKNINWFTGQETKFSDLLGQIYFTDGSQVWVKFGSAAKVTLGNVTSRGADRLVGAVIPKEGMDELGGWPTPSIGADGSKINYTNGYGTDYGVWKFDGESLVTGYSTATALITTPSGEYAPDSFGPIANTNPARKTLLVTDLYFGPATVTLAIPGNGSEAVEKSANNYDARVAFKLDTVGTFYVSWKGQLTDEKVPNEDDDGPSYETIKYNHAVNSLGIYADIRAIEKLVLTAGFSGVFDTVEAKDSDVNKYSDKSFYGIDLRARYTGIDKVAITSHNNASFYDNNAKESDEKVDTFVLYNQVAASIQLTEKLWTKAQLYNVLGTTSAKEGAPGDLKDLVTTYDALGIRADLFYTLTPTATVRAGVAYENHTAYATYDGDTYAKSGAEKGTKDNAWGFKVPIGITFAF